MNKSLLITILVSIFSFYRLYKSASLAEYEGMTFFMLAIITTIVSTVLFVIALIKISARKKSFSIDFAFSILLGLVFFWLLAYLRYYESTGLVFLLLNFSYTIVLGYNIYKNIKQQKKA